MASDTDLRTEMEALRAEVADLRKQQATHYCMPVISEQRLWNNACAGGYATAIYTMNANQPPLVIDYGTMGAAGCAAGNATIYTVSAGN